MKKQLMILLSLLAVSCALVACNSSKPDSTDNKPSDIVVLDKPVKEVPEDEVGCLKEGGTWGKVGLLQLPTCVIKTADGGKSCTDSSQCERGCYTHIGETGKRVTGFCQYNNLNFGCRSLVVKGIAQPGVCSD